MKNRLVGNPRSVVTSWFDRFLGSAGRLVLMVALSTLLVSALATPVVSARPTGPYPIEMANNRCSVTGSPTTCGGAWNSTQTFQNPLKVNEIVTVAFSYLYGNTNLVTLSFRDKLGNPATLLPDVCSAASPAICSEVGFLKVSNPGYDNVLFTVQGGTTGEIWYNAEIWGGAPAQSPLTVGATASCSSSCSGSLSLGPLSPSATAVIAVSTFEAYYPSTPASWQFSYPYWYSATDFISNGGDSVAWQGTSTLLQSYTFSATTNPTPLSWAGAGEIIYWP